MVGLTLTRPRTIIPGGLELSMINSQPIMTFLDRSRGVGSPPAGKRLSIAEQILVYANNQLTNEEWIAIGDISTADSGYVMDLQGTIVFVSGYCKSANGGYKDIHLFLNNEDVGAIGTIVGSTESTFINAAIDLDFDQGDKLRLRAIGDETIIDDTVIKLTIRWRK